MDEFQGGRTEIKECVYIFLDEAGNLDFTSRGTNYFILASASIYRPFSMNRLFDSYKYDCLEEEKLKKELDIEYFHCRKDNKYIRGKIFDFIRDFSEDIHVDSLIIDKSKVSPAMQRDFYTVMLAFLLQDIVSTHLQKGINKIIIITDTIPVNKKRRAVEKGIKLLLADILPTRVKYRILHHSSRSHYGLQIADYCCWAIFQKWERKEMSYYGRIENSVKKMIEI